MSDMKKLLESIDSMSAAEKHPRGPKFPGYWKGTDPASKSKSRMVGGATESLIKELSQCKPCQDRDIEQELQEMWAAFNEEDLGVHPRRPARPGSREEQYGRRGHKEVPRYKNVKETVPTASMGQPNQQQNQNPNQPVDPKDVQAMQQSISQLQSQLPSNLNKQKLTTALAKADQGAKLTPQDTQNLASTLATPLAHVLQTPQGAAQLKPILSKANQLQQAAQKQGTTK